MHRSAVATRKRVRISARDVASLARRGGRFSTPTALAEEGLMEAHAQYENTCNDVVSTLQLLSQQIYAQVKDPVLQRILLAIVHQALGLVKSRLAIGCTRLRQITREVSGVAA